MTLAPELLTNREAIVIGGSAGAVQVLRQILIPLKVDLPVVVVIHLSPTRESSLPTLFAHDCKMRVAEPFDKEHVAPGTIYFGPADYHLMIEGGHTFALSVGPRVYHSRPSIDVLFESAAEAFRERLVGLVLSGANRDGATGVAAIRDKGGLVLVQDPSSSESEEMPRAAIQAASPQFIGPPEQIADVLSRLSRKN